MDEENFSFGAQQELSPVRIRVPLEVPMTVALRPATVKMLIIAAGVLLGLLAIALMVFPQTHAASQGVVLGAGKLHPLGVLWH
jgi:hypothetical protein